MNTEDSQKVLKVARIVLVVLAIFLSLETLLVLKNLRSTNLGYNSISVTGEGEAVSIPDVATFSFSVSADAKTVGLAQGEVTKKMDVILSKIESLGVDKKDIKTTDYSVWPKYISESIVCTSSYCPPSRQIPDGYTASHNVLVKIRKTTDAGTALALVGENGATGLSGITFTVDDPEKIMDEARAMAISDAKEKAKILSKKLGVKLIRVVSFYDNTGGPMPYYGEGMGGDMIKVSASAPTIPVGENEVKINVTITYEIR